MQRKWLLFGCVLMLGIAVWAANPIWRPNQQPPIPLDQALTLAEAQIKSEGAKFYCLRADIAGGPSSAEWLLEYGSRSGKQLWVSVASDRKVRVRHEGFILK